MQHQVNKYLSKLLGQSLIASPGDAQLYGLDDEICTNNDNVPEEVRSIFDRLNINSLIVARPEPVRWAIISELIQANPVKISPSDAESLTFIHDIPVIDEFDPGIVACALNSRKGCIVKDMGIISTGTVSLEQAFVVFSSISFSCFVKYFSDIINSLYGHRGLSLPSSAQLETCLKLLAGLYPADIAKPLSKRVPFDKAGIISSMDEAGKAMVASQLVDSFFGNISFKQDDLIYISQTGSSLDELLGYIDCVPLDGSSTCELTSSSELWAHVKIYELTGDKAILHGHPRFSVIMSMFGEPLPFGQTRYVDEVPVVTGEVGAGRHGLVHTLPKAMQENHSAIVSGHGAFISSEEGFHDAYERLLKLEQRCFDMYSEFIGGRL